MRALTLSAGEAGKTCTTDTAGSTSCRLVATDRRPRSGRGLLSARGPREDRPPADQHPARCPVDPVSRSNSERALRANPESSGGEFLALLASGGTRVHISVALIVEPLIQGDARADPGGRPLRPPHHSVRRRSAPVTIAALTWFTSSSRLLSALSKLGVLTNRMGPSHRGGSSHPVPAPTPVNVGERLRTMHACPHQRRSRWSGLYEGTHLSLPNCLYLGYFSELSYDG